MKCKLSSSVNITFSDFFEKLYFIHPYVWKETHYTLVHTLVPWNSEKNKITLWEKSSSPLRLLTPYHKIFLHMLDDNGVSKLRNSYTLSLLQLIRCFTTWLSRIILRIKKCFENLFPQQNLNVLCVSCQNLVDFAQWWGRN